jgi:hypothetical protein
LFTKYLLDHACFFLLSSGKPEPEPEVTVRAPKLADYVQSEEVVTADMLQADIFLNSLGRMVIL